MPDPSIDALRNQLRDRGYLSHGIERWFALDPFRSRAFWVELATVALKAAVLIALFALIPMTAIMLFRNYPLGAVEIVSLALMYGVAWLVIAFAFIVVLALVLKLRPELAVDTPRALLGISLTAAAVLALGIGGWWSRFAEPPSLPELAGGLALLLVFFLVTTIVVSAALLSFSIYELKRIPALHRKPRTVPMTIAAIALVALLFIPAYAGQERSTAHEPLQVVTTPTNRKVALVAVDGLTYQIFASRDLVSRQPIPALPGASTAERWASIGTGVPTRLHGVRAIEGVRFRGGSHIIQTISGADFLIRSAAIREPLPPTVRRRDFLWELFAHRGIPILGVNWWTSEQGPGSQQSVFAEARGEPLAVDAIAIRRALASHAQFVTVYLPALDVILNRLPLARSAQLAQSVRALEQLSAAIAALRARGYDVILIGMPGDHQDGRGVIASTIALAPAESAYDLAPTLAALLGFPASAEMPGKSLAGDVQRIPTYGTRSSSSRPGKVDEEYYRNLKSLGYIR